MNGLRHVLIVTAALLVLLGIPLYLTGTIQRWLSGTDAISSATTVLDQPGGGYVVLINKEKHTNAKNLEIWQHFFAGEEVDFLFEDISCLIADTDPSGQEIAESFQSRLPANQMKIRKEDITMLLSKADHEKFDVILLSEELFTAYKGDAYVNPERVVILKEEGNEKS